MKRITILNGSADDKYLDFERELNEFKKDNQDKFHLDCFTLRKMNMEYCCGCWNCWLKTPGECVYRDEMPKVLKSVINSDLTIFISPVVMGFVSAYTKKACDRMIPLLHPYICISGNECHHFKRYKKYPRIGLLLLGDTNDAANGNTSINNGTQIITAIFKRIAINLRTKFAFGILSDGNMEVLKNEINHI